MRLPAADALYHAAVLVGRQPACEAVDSMLARAREGISGALVVRGEPVLHPVVEKRTGRRLGPFIRDWLMSPTTPS